MKIRAVLRHSRTLQMKMIGTLVILVWASSVYASVTNVPIETKIELKPGESRAITLEATVPVEVGWRAVQEHTCTMHCVEAADKSGGFEYTIATDLGASMKYTPVEGKIKIEYRNKADHPVVIDVYKVDRVCDAEACRLLKDSDKGKWLVYKIAQFTAIETSEDQSYSTITGMTTSGHAFTVKAIWWTDNKESPFRCHQTIAKYVAGNLSADAYAPYILSGKTMGDDRTILSNIDTCVPKAPHFGVPDENVFQ